MLRRAAFAACSVLAADRDRAPRCVRAAASEAAVSACHLLAATALAAAETSARFRESLEREIALGRSERAHDEVVAARSERVTLAFELETAVTRFRLAEKAATATAAASLSAEASVATSLLCDEIDRTTKIVETELAQNEALKRSNDEAQLDEIESLLVVGAPE